MDFNCHPERSRGMIYPLKIIMLNKGTTKQLDAKGMNKEEISNT